MAAVCKSWYNASIGLFKGLNNRVNNENHPEGSTFRPLLFTSFSSTNHWPIQLIHTIVLNKKKAKKNWNWENFRHFLITGEVEAVQNYFFSTYAVNKWDENKDVKRSDTKSNLISVIWLLEKKYAMDE